MRRAAVTSAEREVMTIPGITRVLQLGTKPFALFHLHQADPARRVRLQALVMAERGDADALALRHVEDGLSRVTRSFFPSSVISIMSAAMDFFSS